MALARVQDNSGQSSATSSATATFGIAATANNLLVAFSVWNVTALANINDPAGWTAVPAASAEDSSNTFGGKFWWKVAAGGETSLTVTCSTGTRTGVLQITEYSGFTTWAQDKANTNDPAGSATTCQTGTTGTLSSASQVVVAGIARDTTTSGGNPTWDSGFTNRTLVTDKFAYGDNLVSANTALNPTCTHPNSANRVGMIVSFMQGATPVDIDTDLRWQMNGTVDIDTDLRWKLGGTLDIDTDLRWLMRGPVPEGWTVRTEADWGGDPLTRPGSFTSLAAVSDGATSLSVKRGTHILAAGMETGTSQGKVDNTGRALDPSNTASSLYPNVRPRTRMRQVITVGGTDHVLHTGFAERFPIEWSQDVGYCTITTQDQLGLTATATLPRSTYEVKIRDLAADFYAPMTEDVSLGTASDIMGGKIGTYAGNVQGGSAKVMVADARGVPLFQRPTNVDAVTSEPRVEWDSITPGHQFTMVVWFRWNTSNAFDGSQPFPLLFSDSTNPSVPLGTATTPKQIIPYLGVIPALPGRHKPVIQIQSGTQCARLTTPVGYTLFDGDMHMAVFEVDGTNKVIKATFDTTGLQTLTDTGEGGTTALSSVNVNSVIDAMVSFSAGWSPGVTPTATTANGWSLGHPAYWNRLLSQTEIDQLWSAGMDAWDGDTTAARLTRVLDWMGIDAGDRNTFAGTQVCGPTLLNQQNAQGYIKKILATEQSEMFIDADGKWTFPVRADYGTPVLVFSDNLTADASLIAGVDVVPYYPVTPDFSYDRIVNDLIIGRENGADQEVTDATSIANYGQIAGTKYRTGQAGPVGKLDTLHQTATAARASAQWLIDRHKDPVTYIPAVTISSIDNAVTLDAMLREIGDTVVVRARPPGGGSPISLIATIEAVQHNFPSPTEWTVTYSLTDGSAYP